MRSYGAVGVIIPLLLATGCGVHQHRTVGTHLDHKKIYADSSMDPLPAPYDQLKVAPTVLGKGRAEALRSGEKGYDFPRQDFDRTLAEMLMSTGGFRNVFLAGEERGSPAGGGEGLVLQVELDSQSITFVERNSHNIWGIVGWISGIFAFPSQWIHDEVYEVRLAGKARILDGESQDVLAEVDLADCQAADSLNFHERTTSVGYYLLTWIIPPTAIPPDEDAVIDCLLPVALAGVLPQLRDGFVAASETPAQATLQFAFSGPDAVKIEFKSPREGEVAAETLDLDFKLVFAKDSSDLAVVKVNDEEIWKYDPSKPVPARKEIPLKARDVGFVNGKITVSVTLFDESFPATATIRVSE